MRETDKTNSFKRAFNHVILFCLTLFIIVNITMISPAQASGTILKLYNQGEYGSIKMTSGAKLSGSGCGIFVAAHAIQWLTGTNPDIKTVTQKCGNTVAGYGTASSYLNKQYDIKFTGGISKTESKVKSVLDNNGVISHHAWGHYILAVGYKTVGGTTYIHIVDSSAGTTVKNCKEKLYRYSDMSPINKYTDIRSGMNYHDGAEYWIKCSVFLDASKWTYSSGDKAGQTCKGLALDALVAPVETTLSGNATFIRNADAKVGPKSTSDSAKKYNTGDTVQIVASVKNSDNQIWYKTSSGNYVNKDDVQLEDANFASGRWYVLSTSKVNGWQSTSSTSNQVKYSYPASQGIIITGYYPKGSSNPTWYRTQEGYYIKSSDLSQRPQISEQQNIGSIKHDNLSINVKSKYSNHWLTAQPYQDKDKMIKVSKDADMKVIKVVYNTANHYWVQVEYEGKLYYACANNVYVPTDVVQESNPVTIKNKVFPDGNLGDIKSFDIKGTVSSQYKITKAIGGVYSTGYTYEKSIDVNKTSFDLYTSNINKKANGGIAFGSIPTGSYTFKLKTQYEKTTWVNQTRDDVDPIQTVVLSAPEYSSTFSIARDQQILVTGITLDTSSKTCLVGDIFYIKETVKPDNASNKKLKWTSSNTSVATVTDGKVTAVGKGDAVITAEAQDNSGKKATCSITVKKPVTSVSVSPTKVTLYLNGTNTGNLTATVSPNDASLTDVEWSSNSADVTVSPNGKITANAVNKGVTITAKAKDGSGKQGTCVVEVRAYVDTVTLSGESTVEVGKTIKVGKQVSPSNASDQTLTWTSSNTAIATVDQNGNVTGVKAGTVTITATATDQGTKKATKQIIVTQKVTGITISGSSHVIELNQTLQLTEHVSPDDASVKTVTWKSDNPTVASVSAAGLVTGKASGTANITATATDGSGVVSIAYDVTVKSYVIAVGITGNDSIYTNCTGIYKATTTPVNPSDPRIEWSSSDTSIATIDSTGMLRALKAGSVTITATALDRGTVFSTKQITVLQGVESLTIDGDTDLHPGDTATWTKTVLPETAHDKTVTWSSSNPSVATVDSTGRVTAVANGTADITATMNSNSNISASRTVTVTTPITKITLSGTNAIDAGSTTQLSATITPSTASNKQLLWTSSDAGVAVVNQQGLVTALAEGTTTITAAAQDGNGKTGTIAITVYPLPNSVTIDGDHDLIMGTSVTLAATVLPMNAQNRQVTWTSSDTSVATVDSSGNVTPKSNGTAVITATAKGNTSVSTSHSVTVTTLVSSITLDAPERIDVGDAGMVTAVVLPNTASNKVLNWISSDESVATVDANGHVTAIKAGYVTITAETTDGTQLSESVEIRIFQIVQSISVDIDNVVYIGQALYPDAIVYPEDASEPFVIWTSGNENIVRVLPYDPNELDDNGFESITATGLGFAKIIATATDGSGVSGFAYVQVINYVNLYHHALTYNLYTTGVDKDTLGKISLTSDTINRAIEDGYGAVWSVEHISGDYAAAIGISEQNSVYKGRSFAGGVNIDLLRINKTGTDVYRITCTINGYSDTCDVTVHVSSPSTPLPVTVALQNSTYTASVNEDIVVNTVPVCAPSGSALPTDCKVVLSGSGNFYGYAQTTMGDDSFTISFNKAGTYNAQIQYYGANYEYTTEVQFVIQKPDGTISPPIEELSIDNSIIYLVPNEIKQIGIGVLPANADASSLTWSSSDGSVATVDQHGLVTAGEIGSTIITVSTDNGVSINALVIVTGSTLSVDWNEDETIQVFLEGNTKTPIQRIYLTSRASAAMSSTPTWTLKRKDGNNLTLTCIPVSAVTMGNQTLYGCDILLKSVSALGTTEYELSCTDGMHTASTIVRVEAINAKGVLPSLVRWQNAEFTANVNQLVTVYPNVICWPDSTSLPDEVTISFDGDPYWNAALNIREFTTSRSMMTFSFSEPGIYIANCIYSCANMRYAVPVTFRIKDSSGNVPVRLMKLTLNESELSIEAGNAFHLSASFSPTDATNKAVIWSSDDPSVATVDENGVVTGVANGTTMIWCIPSDENCSAVKCKVAVEDSFTIATHTEMDMQYLQGDVGYAVAGFEISSGTARRLEQEGLTPTWTLSRVSGNAAAVELQERNGNQYIVVTALQTSGTDVYSVTCTAGTHTWTGNASLEVTDLGQSAPLGVTIAQTDYTAEIGEEIELDFTPVCNPSGATIPTELRASYIGIGEFYNGLEDSYKTSILIARTDKVRLAFKKPGYYILSRYYRSCNLSYVTECSITVGEGEAKLLSCTDVDPVVYIGGKSNIVSTCVIADNSIEELYGDDIVWQAERLSGDCMSVSLRADQSSASLYVANVKEVGQEVWRVSCSFKGITDYVDITIDAMDARTELPESVSLYQTAFNGMIGVAIQVPLAVQCYPEGTSLPSTEGTAWSFVTDGNTNAHADWLITNDQMNITFTESGYYGGRLVYEAGNVSYSVPVNFAITDEESVQSTPDNLQVSVNESSVTVYPEGETDVPIVNALLSSSDSYNLSSIAAYAERVGSAWTLETVSGTACALSVKRITAGSAQIVVDSISGTGDVVYRVKCTVDGTSYTAQGTVHVANNGEERPQPDLRQNYFTTPVGTVLTIDASFYDRTSNAKLCEGKESIWENADALAAMGYSYRTSGDLWMPTFYEAGSYTTTITNMIGNLKISKEVKIAVYTNRSLPGSASSLIFPKALREIDEEAFMGVSVNVIDLRGTNITTIGPNAFSNNVDLMRVYLPTNVTSISTNAFFGCSDFVIYCVEGSDADEWAKQQGYPVLYDMN